MAFEPQNFIDQVGPAVSAQFLNGLDLTVNQGLNGLATQAAIAAWLGVPTFSSPLGISIGGTGANNATSALANLGGTTPTAALAAAETAINPWPVPTVAETNCTGLVVVNPQYPVFNVLRYGIIPNSVGSNAANGAILQTLVNALYPNGPTGQLVFPNTTGTDIYYFDVRTYKCRDGIHIDIQGSTISFSGGGVAASHPIFMAIRDFSIENGTIVEDYTGTGGDLLRLGSRYNDGIGWPANPSAPLGIQDYDSLAAVGAPPQGGYVVRNLRITSNNSSGGAIINLVGSLRNVVLDNLWFDGQALAIGAIYYEWGVASTTLSGGVPANPWTWTTSHASSMRWSNIFVFDLATGANNTGIQANGAQNMVVENIYVNGADLGVAFSSGEAFYYRPWSRDGAYGTPRLITIKNVFCLNTLKGGIQVIGAQTCGPGTLMYTAINALGTVAKSQAQTDFLSFIIDGFKIYADNGIIAGGHTVDIQNGVIVGSGTAASGGIFCTQDTLHLRVNNVEVLNVNGTGLRNNVIPGSPLWSPFRPKFADIRNSTFSGCSTIGIALDQMQTATVEGCKLGYNATYDTANESVQATGVNVGTNCAQNAVVCRNNFTTVAGGGHAYANIGPLQVVYNECNLGYTTSGNWITQMPSSTSTGWGTSSGGAIIANYPGATATLVQTSNALAYIITILQANGILGA